MARTVLMLVMRNHVNSGIVRQEALLTVWLNAFWHTVVLHAVLLPGITANFGFSISLAYISFSATCSMHKFCMYHTLLGVF